MALLSQHRLCLWWPTQGWHCAFLCCSILLGAGRTWATTVYLTPEGNDAWSGLLRRPNANGSDGPVASLQGARDAVRRIRSRAESITVQIADGQYELKEPLVLGPQDSGSATAPIRYQAEPGAHPRFTGGRVLAGWHQGADGIWSTQIKEVADGKWYFEQLWVNGRRATRARTPDNGLFSLSKIIGMGVEGDKQTTAQQAPPEPQRKITLFSQAESLAPLRAVPQADLGDVNLVYFNDWDAIRRQIDSVDLAANSVTIREGISGAGSPNTRNSRVYFVRHPMVNRGKFYLENFRDALNLPGEWFLARDGTLFYKPLPGENLANAVVVAPVVDSFMCIRGNAQANVYVEHVAFAGLSFSFAQWLTPTTGVGPEQAASEIGATIEVDGARDVSFEDCEVAHIGNYAIWFRQSCYEDSVRHCRLHDLGAGGVKIGEIDARPEEVLRTGGIVIDNTIMKGMGRVIPSGVGVWVGESGSNRVTHNDVSDLYYSGISVGWMGSSGGGLATRNLIAFNRIYGVKNLLSDLGGIYMRGAAYGTIVRNNVIHDIDDEQANGLGIYPDGGASEITFENNLIYNINGQGFIQILGKNNVIRNNIIAFTARPPLRRGVKRKDLDLAFSFTNNIVYWRKQIAGRRHEPPGSALQGDWVGGHIEMNRNIYFAISDAPILFEGRSFEAWQKAGFDRDSIFADPLFVDPSKYDFNLRPGSPALSVGFVPFDYSEAGVYGDARWKALSEESEF
jgi:hypothetical protein